MRMTAQPPAWSKGEMVKTESPPSIRRCTTSAIVSPVPIYRKHPEMRLRAGLTRTLTGEALPMRSFPAGRARGRMRRRLISVDAKIEEEYTAPKFSIIFSGKHNFLASQALPPVAPSGVLMSVR